MTKRLISLALIILLAGLPVLSACSDEGGEASDTEETSADTGSGYRIADYSIIRSDRAEKPELETVMHLRRTLNAICGGEMGITTDWEKEPERELEILVGAWEREISAQVREELRGDDFTVTELDGGRKIIIEGLTDKALAEAVDYFLEEYFGYTGEDTDMAAIAREYMPVIGDYSFEGECLLRGLTVGGSDISEFIISYEGNNELKSLAAYLSLCIGELTGVTPAVKSAAGGGAAIIFTADPSAKGWSITISDGKAVFLGANLSELTKAYKHFVTECLQYGTRATGGAASLPSEIHLTSADSAKG